MKDLVERLAKEEIRVTILVDRRLDQEIVLPESNLLSIISFRDERYKVLRRPFKRLERFRFPWWLYSQIDQLRPTQVLAFLNRFSVYCVVIRWLLRLKGVNFRLVLNEGILTSKYLNQYERFYWRYLVRWFYRGADRIIVPTVAVKIDLIRNFSVPGKLIIVVPSWVPGEIRPTKTVKKYDGIYAGRISPEKGINTLVHLGEMIRKNKLTFRLALVGEG
ncbi:glycosyltransferase, partial [Patescibacteria group bacterium]|nr:glycosyltransferase [Patescibacteria group bacterium]